MEPKQLEALGKLVDTAVNKLQTPLRAIAILKMANVFYSDEERRELSKEFSKLRVDAKLADDAHNRFGRGLRAEHGENVPLPEAVARDDLWKVASALHDRIAAFRTDHPLIQEIVDSRNALCARDHLNRLL